MEDMIAAFRKVFLKNYATFAGRASRGEFWWYVLAVLLLNIIVNLIDAFAISPMLGMPGDTGILSAILGLVLILPGLAVSARRLHDTGRSAWWLLLWLLPVIGFLVLLYFYVQRSDEGANRFGAPDPWIAPAGGAA
ncbi:DUF805 domain-containing protein [Mangrovicoccus sp. HB161399]|uniref:DUF805 domain-containing protein n=1 Tax=Mangrovicoccus sp. HB161399 TaxID=2720392 RepID=UPI001C12D17A|nr:DUF805 domain-containing protein [Mangrovicoccus sp. HB161399]